MNAQDLTTISTFESGVLANVAKNTLEAEGIRAYLSGEWVSWLLPMGQGFSSIKLQVALSDSTRAVEILKPLSEVPAKKAFACSKCGAQIDAGFEVCWSCGATKIH